MTCSQSCRLLCHVITTLTLMIISFRRRRPEVNPDTSDTNNHITRLSDPTGAYVNHPSEYLMSVMISTTQCILFMYMGVAGYCYLEEVRSHYIIEESDFLFDSKQVLLPCG